MIGFIDDGVVMIVRWMRYTGLIVGLLASLGGCGEETSTLVQPDLNHVYWALTLNHRGILMSTVAPYDTIQLVASPCTVTGAVLRVSSVATFTSSDSSISVSPTGLVTALRPKQNVAVVATLTQDGITHADTAIITVTTDASPQVLKTFSIQPPVGASPRVSLASYMSTAPEISSQALDTLGQPISGVVICYASSNPSIADVEKTTGRIVPNHSGVVTFYAATTVYGVHKQDSVVYTVYDPLAFGIQIVLRTPMGSTRAISAFEPGIGTVAVGAVVWWDNVSGQPVDVIFDDSLDVQSIPPSVLAAAPLYQYFPHDVGGNIAPFTQASFTTLFKKPVRYFPVAGTYHYHSSLYGTSGTLIVR